LNQSDSHGAIEKTRTVKKIESTIIAKNAIVVALIIILFR
jgi:hypothetical protein